MELGNASLPDYIHVDAIPPTGQQFVEGALGRLHRGELEAMVLARDIQAHYVLLDDWHARNKAKRMGLRVMGTIGVIVLSYRVGHITGQEGARWIDQLVNQHGLYLSLEIQTSIRQIFEDGVFNSRAQDFP